MKTQQKFYIGRRDNPQFKNPYYVAYGQISKTKAAKKEKCLYGSMTLEAFESEDDYTNKIKQLKSQGFSCQTY